MYLTGGKYGVRGMTWQMEHRRKRPMRGSPVGLDVLRRAKPKAFRPRKCSESGSSVMMTKGCRAFLIAGSGKPRHGHEKRRGSPKQRRGHEKQARAEGSEPETTGGSAAAGRRSCGGAPPRPRPTRGQEALTQKARKFNARKICPNLDSSSKTDLETRGKHRVHSGAFKHLASLAKR